MTKFITTIQLLNATEKDYNELHRELEKQSFKEKRKESKDAVPGQRQYKTEGNVSIQDVTGTILKAAYKTGKQFSFTIIKNKPFQR
jgi:hypothetical protein